MYETFRYDVLNNKIWKYIIIKKKLTVCVTRMRDEDPTHMHLINLFPQPPPILFRK